MCSGIRPVCAAQPHAPRNPLSACIACICRSYWDVTASLLELLGFTIVAGCLVWAALGGRPAVELVWLGVAVAERATHLPAALRGDAGWMRSYDLWEELVREHGARETEDPSRVQPPASRSCDVSTSK